MTMFTKEIFLEIYCKCSILNITKKRGNLKFLFPFSEESETI